jgi:hypothetical protein
MYDKRLILKHHQEKNFDIPEEPIVLTGDDSCMHFIVPQVHSVLHDVDV